MRRARGTRRWTWLWTSGVLLVATLATVQAFADSIVGRLRSGPYVLTSGPDVEAFLRLDAEETWVPPPVALSLADRVALELQASTRTLGAAAAFRAARTLCEEAARGGLDPLLVVAIIGVESAFDHLAISPAGAEGLLQLMPPTARWLAEHEGLAWSPSGSFDPELNVRLGVRYLVHLRQRFSTPAAWLTAYNRGPTATRALLRRQGQLPARVRRFYADKVLAAYDELLHRYGESAI